MENIVYLLSRSENNMADSGHVTCGDDHEADVVDEGEPALQQLSTNPRIKILLKKTGLST